MYRFLFQKPFEADDALADILAFCRICLQSIHSDVLIKQVKSEAKPLCYLLEKSDFDVYRVKNFFRLLKLDKPSKRLANSGISPALLLEMWSKFGTTECNGFLQEKSGDRKMLGQQEM